MSSFDPDPNSTGDATSFIAEPVEGASETENSFVAIRLGGESASDDTESELTPEEVREQAYAEGVAAGRAELPWQEATELQGLIDTLEEALAGVAELRRNSLREHRVAVVELAVAIAERLVRQSIEADTDKLAAIVERSVSTLPDESKLRVLLSSADYDALQAGMASTLASFCDQSGAVIEASAELARGDVRVLGVIGDVDARVTSQLGRVREALSDLYDIPEAPP